MEANNTIKVHIAGLSVWRGCFEALKNIVSSTKSSVPIPLVVAYDSVSVHVFDAHRCAIAHLVLEVETTNLAPQTRHRLVVHADLFAAALRLAKEENDVILSFDTDGKTLLLREVATNAAGGTSVVDTELSLLDDDVAEPPAMHEDDLARFPIAVDTQLSVLRDIVDCADRAEIAAPTLDISVTRRVMSSTEIVNHLTFSVLGDEGKLKRRFRFDTIHVDVDDAGLINLDEAVSVEQGGGTTVQIVSSSIAVKYLSPFVKSLQSQAIRLLCGVKMPVFITYPISEQSRFTLLVMARLADDDLARSGEG